MRPHPRNGIGGIHARCRNSLYNSPIAKPAAQPLWFHAAGQSVCATRSLHNEMHRITAMASTAKNRGNTCERPSFHCADIPILRQRARGMLSGSQAAHAGGGWLLVKPSRTLAPHPASSLLDRYDAKASLTPIRTTRPGTDIIFYTESIWNKSLRHAPWSGRYCSAGYKAGRLPSRNQPAQN